jgi:hypothetical protein
MIREDIVTEVARILHGPIGGLAERLDNNPLDFYSTGILFPQHSLILETEDHDENLIGKVPEFDEVNEVTNNKDFDIYNKRRVAEEIDESNGKEELELTTKFRPSAAGISVLVDHYSEIQIIIKYATYQKITPKKEDTSESSFEKKNSFFERAQHDFTFKFINGEFLSGDIKCNRIKNTIWVDLNGDAQLNITTRNYPSKGDKRNLLIRTCTIINKKNAVGFHDQKKAEDCLFQPEIIISAPKGFHYFEDHTDLSALSEEDLNLKLLYRNYKIYAQGHGISANWIVEHGIVTKVLSQVLPTENVNGVELNPAIFNNSKVLFIKRLSGISLYSEYNWESIRKEFKEFVGLYKIWIDKEANSIDEVLFDERLRTKARNNLLQCTKLFERMSIGIKILDEDNIARKAFEDANRAMFMQRVMADFSAHRRSIGRVQHQSDQFDDPIPDYKQIPYDAAAGKIWDHGKLSFDLNTYDRSGTLARWRPFQLAFLLSQIKGITDPNSADRDTIDLIWFPTGGGKTEAYLGIAAFTILYRRLKAKDSHADPNKGAGVAVLMRYTLRLLNKQQFERATILICACDLIRRNEPENYGSIRISNGIWMGSSMTPNKEKIQIDDYTAYIKSINNNQTPNSYKSSPPLMSCPCCGNRLVREVGNNSPVGRWGYFRELNLKNKQTGRFLIGCTNTKCVFHATAETFALNKDYVLPVYEVDETIYSMRPSLLFSTVDKFVQLAWNSEAFNLFNIEFTENSIHRKFPPPDLIIQDELHLISSALGTIYGVYEIAIDRLCRESGGSIAKVIGATATVRNASEQCKRLYGRRHFLQFPPPGTDADNSFYSVKIKGTDPKNRLYVGFMPSGVTTSTALIRLSAVLLERIPSLKYTNEILDSYYTLVVYFNALKELGKFRTFLTDDIVSYRKLLANYFLTFHKPFNQNSLCELSSVMTADEITSGLDRLEKTTLSKNLDYNNPLIKNLLDAGIRTYSDLLNAKGGRVWNRFINQDFFNRIGLKFTGDSKVDYQSFLSEVKRLNFAQPEPIQIAPATNMISVGVDIPRLNTMIVNGQPKTTAEYIQASSRVGRIGPGVVFTFLAPTKNRDRSHYEQFKAFHQSYYYYVEASSVTPFSQPALEKVLPTVFIALTRSLFLKGNGGVFDPSTTDYLNFILDIVNDIKLKATAIYGLEADVIHKTVDTIYRDFTEKISRNQNRRLANYIDFIEPDTTTGKYVTKFKNPNALYNAPAQFVDEVLKDHIATLQTLRNVESSSRIRIKTF